MGRCASALVKNTNAGEGFEDREGNRMDKAGAGVFLESTLFHELTHYGHALNGKMDKSINGVKEGGKDFEKAVYGEDVNDQNAKDIATKINWEGQYLQYQIDNLKIVPMDGTNAQNWTF